VVTGNPFHASGMQRRSAKQVTATDHHADLNAETDQLTDFDSHAVQHLGIDTEFRFSSESLTGEFQKDSIVLAIPVGHGVAIPV
jgi:hypothetical protein